MELHHLRYFVAVAEAASFRRASERLHIAQPSLTRAVRQLEAELGCALLVRSPRGVSITKEGTAVIERAQRVLESVASLGRGLTREAEVLRIAHVMPEYLRVGALSTRLRAFRASHPGLELAVTPLLHRRLLEQLVAGKMDVGFGWLPLEDVPRGLVVESVMTDQPVVALPPTHRRAAAGSIRLRDLARDRFLLFPRRAMPERYDEIAAMLARAGIDPTIETHRPHLGAVLAAVANGDGVSIVPRLAVRAHAKVGVALAEIDGVSAAWHLAIVSKKSTGRPLIDAFVAAMRGRQATSDRA